MSVVPRGVFFSGGISYLRIAALQLAPGAEESGEVGLLALLVIAHTCQLQ